MQEEGGMVLKRVSTIIPLGNLTRRGTAKEFESKRRKLSEPGPMKNRNSWIGNTEVDGLDECKVLAQGSSMKYSMFTVIWMSFIFLGIGVFEGCIVFFLSMYIFCYYMHFRNKSCYIPLWWWDKRFCKSWLITLVSFFAMPFANSRQELKRELP